MKIQRLAVSIAAVLLGSCGNLLPDVKVTVTIPLSTLGDTACTTTSVSKKLTDYDSFNNNKDKIDVNSAELTAARVVIKSVDTAVNTATTADGTATVTAGSDSFGASVSGVSITADTKADITFDPAAAKKVAKAAMSSPYQVDALLVGTPHGSVAMPVCKFSVDLELDFVVKPKVL